MAASACSVLVQERDGRRRPARRTRVARGGDRGGFFLGLGGLAASSATASAVKAPACRTVARPATRYLCAIRRHSRSTSIRARVPSLSLWIFRAASHQASSTGVNLPAERACSLEQGRYRDVARSVPVHTSSPWES